jgi:hypothetical protein
VPLDFEALNTSMVYAPGDVEARMDKASIYTFLNAVLNQYDNEDFDLGIKQFMIEQVGTGWRQSGVAACCDMRCRLVTLPAHP